MVVEYVMKRSISFFVNSFIDGMVDNGKSTGCNIDGQVYSDLAWKDLTNGEVTAFNTLQQADQQRIVRRIMAEQYRTSDNATNISQLGKDLGR